MLEPGETLGRYRIKQLIGAGGMGVVYLAHDEKLDRDLALKLLKPGILDDESARKRFRNEARVLSRLNHPSIQTIYDFETTDGVDYLVSEFIAGKPLEDLLRPGPLPEKEVVRIGLQLADGLTAAHAAGVLHRDLKPANLRLTADRRLKILDFGLATLSQSAVSSLSKTLSVADAPAGISGTLPYMPPEQLLGEQIDERSDIYSAGVALYELATAKLPFEGALVSKLTNAIIHEPPLDPRKINASLSEEFKRIVLKCLEKDSALRYASATDLAVDLRRLELRSFLPSAPHEQMQRKKSWIVPATLVAIAVFALAVFFASWLRQDAPAGDLALRWEQITNFTDSASFPALSPDGKMLAFVRGPGEFGGSGSYGQVWLKQLPDGAPIQLTDSFAAKDSPVFGRDSNRLYFTQVENQFTWNTYELSLLGSAKPKMFMANASGLSWVSDSHLLFSEIRHGIHMVLASSNVSRTDERNVYVPADEASGMAHRSALSPDGKSVLAVEMDARDWLPCRLLPFDGSSQGRVVGPDGPCTAVAWSPDGKWMYFSADYMGRGYHVWRQRFPDGEPQQMTPTGASEEEGLAVSLDGKFLVTAAGTQRSAIWLHDRNGDRQLTSEGFAILPTLERRGTRVYYLLRAGGAKSFISGELWSMDLKTGTTDRILPGVVISQYHISPDGKRVLFIVAGQGSRSGIWISDLDGVQAPRQLTSGGEFRAFFGRPGEVIYQTSGSPYRLMHVSEDGSDRRVLSPIEILHEISVSPDGEWVAVTVTPAKGHGDRVTMVQLIPVAGGDPVTICDQCIVGFGPSRTQAPPVSWSADGRWFYVSLRYFGVDSQKTAAIPLSSHSAPPAAIRSLKSEKEFLRLPGTRIIPEEFVFPGDSPDRYVMSRRSVQSNLFRLYLSSR